MNDLRKIISEDLQKKAGFFELKPGEKRIYQLLGVKPNPDPEKGGILCPASKEAWNTYIIRDMDHTPKTINHVVRERPAPAGSMRDFIQELGYLNFTKEENGKITIYGDNYDVNKDMVLFFHPQNKSTEGLPNYKKPKFGYVFETINPEKKAEDNLTALRNLRVAMTLVDEMPDSDIRMVGEELLEESLDNVSTSVIRNRLMLYVQAEANTKRFLSLNKDHKTMIRKTLNAAKTKGIIKQVGQDAYVWADTGENMCTKKEGKTLSESFIMYAVTPNGQEVLKTLNSLIET